MRRSGKGASIGVVIAVLVLFFALYQASGFAESIFGAKQSSFLPVFLLLGAGLFFFAVKGITG